MFLKELLQIVQVQKPDESDMIKPVIAHSSVSGSGICHCAACMLYQSLDRYCVIAALQVQNVAPLQYPRVEVAFVSSIAVSNWIYKQLVALKGWLRCQR